jgi:3-hydroxy-9,10-secoandrosta-1,3,5(10)-triene-9,17-dione monooxygenase reductase component
VPERLELIMTGITPLTGDFRRALSVFATGVTIVTTLDERQQPVGVTASSFNSVSLDPPLVLWSLAKSALSYRAFATSGHFAIHVLAQGQIELANTFARSRENKFAGLEWRPGTWGSPLLEHYAARFECSRHHRYEGGDHSILVGKVMACDRREVAPLLFHNGAYAQTPHPLRKMI